MIDTYGLQYVLADVDDDPESEVVAANRSFGHNAEGLLTFIDFACR